MEIEILIEQMRQGNERAFEEFYQNTYGLVLYHCRQYLRDELDAQEVTQDVFLAVFQGIERLQEPKAWKRWLLQITHNLAIKKATRGRQTTLSLDDETVAPAVPADVEADPDRQLDRLESQRLVAQMVESLPQEQRITVILYYYDSLKIAEIAGVMACSEGTVKSRLNYARKAIEKQTLDMERKHGVKLYSAALPALLLAGLGLKARAAEAVPAFPPVLQQAAQAAAQSAAAVGLSAGAATTTGAASAVTAAGTTAAAGITKAIGTKIVAGVLAGVLAIGGGVTVLTTRDASPSIEAPPTQTESVDTLPVHDTALPAPSEQPETPEPNDHTTLPPEPEQNQTEAADSITTPEQPKEPENPYHAYAAVLQDYWLKYGKSGSRLMTSVFGERRVDLTGVSVVELVDFDGDGSEELLLVYGKDDILEYMEYQLAIWRSTDGETAQLVCEKDIYQGAQSYSPCLRLLQDDSGAMLMEYTHTADESMVYWTVAEGQPQELLNLESYWYGGEQFFVNGSEVSHEDFQAAEAQLTEGMAVTDYLLSVGTFDDAQPIHTATKDTLIQLGVHRYGNAAETSGVPYSDYLRLVKGSIMRYGPAALSDTSSYDRTDDMPALTGTPIVRLADLTGDGLEELIVVTMETSETMAGVKTGPFQYWLKIWTCDGNGSYWIPPMDFDGKLYSGAHEPYLEIRYRADGSAFLRLSAEGVDGGYGTRILQYDGEIFVTTDLPVDKLNQVDSSYINGVQVSDAEFTARQEAIYADTTAEFCPLSAWIYRHDPDGGVAYLQEALQNTLTTIETLKNTY